MIDGYDYQIKCSRKVVRGEIGAYVKSLQAMRGSAFLVGVGVVAELGDLTRFDHPSKLMAYVGLTPSEHSSGPHRRLGAITKCGNGRARRLLVEGARSLSDLAAQQHKFKNIC